MNNKDTLKKEEIKEPKGKLRKFLSYLILFLIFGVIAGGVYFYFQNEQIIKNKFIKPKVQEASDFSIDQILIKVLIKKDGFIEKQVRLANLGSSKKSFYVSANGLEAIVKIDSTAFELGGGQSRSIVLNFSSIDDSFQQEPGIYIGKLIIGDYSTSREIPIIVEVESPKVIFDMNLNPVVLERSVKPGTDTTIEVKLFNLESVESVNVDVEYFVKDINGNTIITEGETVVVRNQASFFKTLSIPKSLNEGTYVFGAKAKFGSSVGTSSYLFEVSNGESGSDFIQLCKKNNLCLALSISSLLLIFAIVMYVYFFIGAYIFGSVSNSFKAMREKKQVEKFQRQKEQQALDRQRIKENLEKIKKEKLLQQKREREKQKKKQRKEKNWQKNSLKSSARRKKSQINLQ